MLLLNLITISLAYCQTITHSNKPTTLEFSCDKKLICSLTNPSCPDNLNCKASGSPGINIGCCSKSTPIIEPELTVCGGFTNLQCPAGFECKYGEIGSIGQCEPLPRCEGFAGQSCPEGSGCINDSLESTSGVCIKLKMCGGFANAKCPDGLKCQYLEHADYGYCSQ